MPGSPRTFWGCKNLAAEDNWSGRVGHVQDCVLEDHLDIANAEVYACGSPAMVEEAHKRLVGAGLPDEAFYSDAFTFARDSKK